jgi:hypothetical protein
MAAEPHDTPAPRHCAICGWPLSGTTCEACQSPADARLDADEHANVRLLGEPRPEDYPDLEKAFVAWQQRDYNRMIGQCLRSLEIDRPHVVTLPKGPGWAFVDEGAAIYLAIDRATDELSIESPMVWVPRRQRVPLLRALLELNALVLGAARFCLRGDRVILRFADRVENLNPPKLVNAIEEVSELAEQYAELLSVSFAAEMIGPEAQRKRLPWDYLGTPRRLVHLVGSEAQPLPWAGGEAQPGPAPVARQALERAIEAQLEPIDGLSDLLRAGVDLGRPLPLLGLHPATPLLLSRAMVLRAVHEYAEACPSAVGALAHEAAPIIARLWLTPPDFNAKRIRSQAAARRLREGLPDPASLSGVINDILATRGQMGETPPIALPRLSGMAATREHLGHYLEEMARAPQEPDLQYYLLLGALAELLERAPLAEDAREHFGRIYDDCRRRGPTAEALAALRAELERMAA